MLNLGQSAPDFTLPNESAIPTTLHDFLGQWIVLYFYPEDDTPGCTTEARGFRDSLDELTKEGIVVLGVSPDTVESHKQFHMKYHLNFHVLADPDKQVINQYGAWQEKNNYGRKYWGVQRMTFLIDPEGIIRHIYKRVSPRGHETQVLAKIKQLG